MKDKTILKFQVFYFLLIGSVGAFIPYINVYLEKEVGLTGSQIGTITAISLIIGVCIAPIWGIIGDKTRKYNNLLSLSLILTIAILFIYSQQTAYIGCVLCAAVLEMTRIGSTPMADTISMDYVTKHHGNYGAIRGMGSLGYMLTSMLIGFLAVTYGYKTPMFYGYIILLVLSLLLTFTFPKPTSKEEDSIKMEKGSIKELLKNKHFLFILLISMLTMCVIDSSGTYAGNHLVSTLNATSALISWQTFIQVLPEVIFLAVAIKFIRKMGYKKFYFISVCLMALRLAIYAFVPNAYVFVIAGLFHCLGVACQTVGNLGYLKATVNPAVYGTAITLMNAAMSIGKAAYGYAFGFVYQYSSSFMIFSISLAFVVIAIILIGTTHLFDEATDKLQEKEANS